MSFTASRLRNFSLQETKTVRAAFQNYRAKGIKNEKTFELNLSLIWLLIRALALTLPVFLPPSANPQYLFQDIIGTVTAAMYILSFPFGLLALPLMFLAKIFMGVNPQTIVGMYVNVFLLCVLGYVQWFWIVPRLLRSESRFQISNLLGAKSNLELSEAAASNNPEFRDSQERTTVERIIHEEDSK